MRGQKGTFEILVGAALLPSKRALLICKVVPFLELAFLHEPKKREVAVPDMLVPDDGGGEVGEGRVSFTLRCARHRAEVLTRPAISSP